MVVEVFSWAPPELLAGCFPELGRITVQRSCLARKTKTTCSIAAHFNTKVPPWATGIAKVALLASPLFPSGLAGFGCSAPEWVLAHGHTHAAVTSGGAEATGVRQHRDAPSYRRDQWELPGKSACAPAVTTLRRHGYLGLCFSRFISYSITLPEAV